jgi:hypothetical protein
VAEHFGKAESHHPSDQKFAQVFFWLAMAVAIVLGIGLRSIHLTDVFSRKGLHIFCTANSKRGLCRYSENILPIRE